VLRTPVGSHLEALTPPPARHAPAHHRQPGQPAGPPPQPGPSLPGSLHEGDALLIVTVDRADCARHNVRWPGKFLLAGGRLTHVPTMADVKSLRKAGVGTADISLALYRNLGGK
jgi:hypothetical protein